MLGSSWHTTLEGGVQCQVTLGEGQRQCTQPIAYTRSTNLKWVGQMKTWYCSCTDETCLMVL